MWAGGDATLMACANLFARVNARLVLLEWHLTPAASGEGIQKRHRLFP